MADARNILVTQLKRYRLCEYCLERHGGRRKPEAPCFICRGLMLEKDSLIQKMLSATREYEYDTFLVGAVLPTQIYEREDAMRARLKIRGKESVKNQLTRELGLGLSNATGKKVDYFNPDLMINLVVDKQNSVDVSARSRPLTLRGWYLKKAPGLPQKQARCLTCGGKGCCDCGLSGLSGYDSIEGTLARQIMNQTGGRTPKFSWLGSEDRNSLVLGKGRPFYVKVFDPRKRRLSGFTVNAVPLVAKLSPNAEPIAQVPFTVKTRVIIRCDRVLRDGDLGKVRSLAGSEVEFEIRAKKIAAKKIYSAIPRRVDEYTFRLTLVADGGLMIKQFVGGEQYMKPNVSELVGSKCKCVNFDILDIDVGNRMFP